MQQQSVQCKSICGYFVKVVQPLAILSLLELLFDFYSKPWTLNELFVRFTTLQICPSFCACRIKNILIASCTVSLLRLADTWEWFLLTPGWPYSLTDFAQSSPYWFPLMRSCWKVFLMARRASSVVNLLDTFLIYSFLIANIRTLTGSAVNLACNQIQSRCCCCRSSGKYFRGSRSVDLLQEVSMFSSLTAFGLLKSWNLFLNLGGFFCIFKLSTTGLWSSFLFCPTFQASEVS